MREDMLTIGAFAKAVRLSPKALRLYDELGLLKPGRVDPDTGYRYYAVAQLERARLVAWLRRLGMPLARIRQVCALPPRGGGRGGSGAGLRTTDSAVSHALRVGGREPADGRGQLSPSGSQSSSRTLATVRTWRRMAAAARLGCPAAMASRMAWCWARERAGRCG